MEETDCEVAWHGVARQTSCSLGTTVFNLLIGSIQNSELQGIGNHKKNNLAVSQCCSQTYLYWWSLVIDGRSLLLPVFLFVRLVASVFAFAFAPVRGTVHTGHTAQTFLDRVLAGQYMMKHGDQTVVSNFVIQLGRFVKVKKANILGATQADGKVDHFISIQVRDAFGVFSLYMTKTY